MKRLFIVLIAVCMLLCACGEKHDGIYTVEEMGESYKTQGRTIVYDGKGIALLSSADSFEFNADCEGKVSVTLVGENMDDPLHDTQVYFTVYVDGERLDVRPEVT
ncbi:MAG: hypothetical protein IKU19_08570, partial [Clostridia bacterium]|nr:hypothetical protein [Clostridia bacterium]